MSDVVFLSAAPNVRRFCTAEVIAGVEFEVTRGRMSLLLDGRPAALSSAPKHKADSEPADVPLEARWTGRSYRGLPWWEVRRPEDWR